MAEGVLRPALDGLEAELVVLAEPFDPDLEDLAEALEVLAGGPRLALWLEFHDAGPALGRGAAELPVEALGIDFYATHVEALPAGFEKLLLAGVVDARSSVPEEPREIAGFVERLDVERIALVPNGDLQYVSQSIALEKIARLGKAKAATTEAAA
jgi:methionine synthase II (cobalamin-independent)